MDAGATLWSARQIRTSMEAVDRECQRLAAHIEGATPGLRDRVKLLALDAQRLAERARSVQHALEAEIGDRDPLTPAA